MRYHTIEELIGQTLVEVTENGDELLFVCENGDRFKLYHDQDCCESVRIDDINGDLNDLVGSPILMAEKTTNSDETLEPDYGDESYTWTFYRFATVKGYVNVRWYGSSNGYYSEGVDFVKC